MTELTRILGAIEVQTSSTFTCAGRAVETKPGHSADGLLASLTDFLYKHCYIRKFDGSLAEPLPQRKGERGSAPLMIEPDLVERLRAAHTGCACRETAWVVTQRLDDGRIVARKGHAVRHLNPGHYVNLDSAVGLPQKDGRVAVYRPTESTVLQASWYYVFGEAVGDSEEGDNLIRFYWNLRPEGGPELVGLLTSTLDRFQIPFRFKIPMRSELYDRRDAAVLYANRRYYPILAILLEDIRDRIAAHLDPGIPLFTRKLADGLGLAEDPDTKAGESFGMNRCEILAHALVNAAEKKLVTVEEKRAELNAEFRKRGLSLERPWLNPLPGSGVAADYDFPAVHE